MNTLKINLDRLHHPCGTATVAATVFTLTCSLCLWGSGAEAASGQAPEDASKGNSLTYTVETIVREGWPPFRQRFYTDVSHGRVEALGTIQVEDWVGLRALRLVPEKKVAYRFSINSPQWKAHAKNLMQTFSNPIAMWPNGQMKGAEKVRDTQIDGRTVDVYRLRTLDKTLWISDVIGQLGKNDSLLSYVDRQTQLPVRVEAKWGETGRWIIWKDFDWNKPLDPDLFRLDIPDGYTVLEKDPADEPAETITQPAQPAQEPAVTVVGDGSGPPPAQLAFADVLRNINAAETLTCTIRSHLAKLPTLEGRMSLRRDAYRLELPSLIVYVEDHKQGKATHLTLSLKRAWQWHLDKGAVTETRQRFPNPVDLFRNVKVEQGKTTNTIRIGGRTAVAFRVDGFATSDAPGMLPQAKKAELRVYSDPRTALPVEISLRLDDPEASFMWLDIQWGKNADPQLFKLDVPDGYTVIEESPPRGGLGGRMDEWKPSAPAIAK